MNKTIVGATVVVALLGLGAGSAYAGPTPTPAVTHVAPNPAQKRLPTAVLGTQKALLLGDSITYGSQLYDRARTNLGTRLAQVLGIDPSRVINHGVTGLPLISTPAGNGLVDRYQAEIDALSPGDVVYVNIGINDLRAYAGDGPWTSAYTAIVDYAKAKGVYFVGSTVTPLGSTNGSWEGLRHNLNTWLLRTYPQTLNYSFLEVGNVPGAGYITWIQWQFKRDEMHPNEGATACMADALASALFGAGWWLG